MSAYASAWGGVFGIGWVGIGYTTLEIYTLSGSGLRPFSAKHEDLFGVWAFVPN